jgi:hypothetical protein
MGEDMMKKGWRVEQLGGGEEEAQGADESVGFWDTAPKGSGKVNSSDAASRGAPVNTENGVWDTLINLPPPTAASNVPSTSGTDAINSNHSVYSSAYSTTDHTPQYQYNDLREKGDALGGAPFRWSLQDEMPKMRTPRAGFVRGASLREAYKGEDEDDGGSRWRRG